MNLNYVKEFLKSRKNNIKESDADELIQEIEAYQGTERNLTDMSRIMYVVNEYYMTFLTEVEQYEALPKETEETLFKRIEKVRGILCTLSALYSYLIISLASIKDSTYDTKNIRGYLTDLNDKKEHFKSEKITWVTILKSLIQESNHIIELRKLDIK